MSTTSSDVSKIKQYRWFVEPDTTGLTATIEQMDDELDSYDKDCLISTFWSDEMMDYIDEFFEQHEWKPKWRYTQTPPWNWSFTIDVPNACPEHEVLTYFKAFQSGRFSTKDIQPTSQ